MLPLLGRRWALCRLAASRGAADTLPGRSQSWLGAQPVSGGEDKQEGSSGQAEQAEREPQDANFLFYPPEAALADELRHATGAQHVHLKTASQDRHSCGASTVADSVRPWQQGQEDEQGVAMCRRQVHITWMCITTNAVHTWRADNSAYWALMAMRSKATLPLESRRVCPLCGRLHMRAPPPEGELCRACREAQHSSSDGSSQPDVYSEAHGPADTSGRRTHGSSSPTTMSPGLAPQSGPPRQDAGTGRQQPRVQRSDAPRSEPHTMRGNAPGATYPPAATQPFAPGNQQQAAWWAPPSHQPRSPAGPPLPRAPVQPLKWEPVPPPPAAKESLLPDDAEIRLVREDKTHEVLTYKKAMREAQRAGLDLIGVALSARPPVFRLGNADKAAHAARQREKELRRKEVETRRKHTVKEVRIGPKVAEHDLLVKLKQARSFVEKNYRVKLFVPYRMSERQDAFVMLGRLRELGGEFAAVANPAVNERLARNTYAIFLSPKA